MDAKRETLSWRVGPRHVVALDRPHIMGILNVTPDSFSDGGAYPSQQAAIEAALRMRDEGAAIIDVGGESTRPGSQPVDAAEQIRRVVPVIEGIRARVDERALLLSIDTTRSEVAQAAIDAGANIINDTSAGRDDENMLPLAASRGCGIVLMHRLKRPQHDSFSTEYSKTTMPDYGRDIVAFISGFLSERRERAIGAGIEPAAIAIDPGLGFGKTVEQNFELAGRIGEFQQLSSPVFSAASRKSFIGAASGEQRPADRVIGSVAISVLHWMAGIRLFRVHDVLDHAKALAIAQAVTERAMPHAAD